MFRSHRRIINRMCIETILFTQLRKCKFVCKRRSRFSTMRLQFLQNEQTMEEVVVSLSCVRGHKFYVLLTVHLDIFA